MLIRLRNHDTFSMMVGWGTNNGANHARLRIWYDGPEIYAKMVVSYNTRLGAVYPCLVPWLWEVGSDYSSLTKTPLLLHFADLLHGPNLSIKQLEAVDAGSRDASSWSLSSHRTLPPPTALSLFLLRTFSTTA